MARAYFQAYYSYLDSMKRLDDAARGRLFTALLAYSSEQPDRIPQLEGMEGVLFDDWRQDIDRDVRAYEVKCRRMSENARKRWDRAETDEGCGCMQEEEKYEEKDEEKNKDKEKDEDNTPAVYNPLYPPFGETGGALQGLERTVEEWLAYKAEKKQAYTPKGRRRLMKQLEEKVRKYGPGAVDAVIRDSMANNYSGILFDKLGRPGGGAGAGNPFLELLREEADHGS